MEVNWKDRHDVTKKKYLAFIQSIIIMNNIQHEQPTVAYSVPYSFSAYNVTNNYPAEF